MLSILGSLLGFASSAVPAITDSFARKTDNKHELDKMKFDSVILAVGHNEFIELDYDKILKNNNSFIYDIKNFVDNKFKNLYKLWKQIISHTAQQ